LREMYLNLLANAMNSDYDKAVHPSYVDIIKQMNRLDALVFSKLAKYAEKYIKTITPTVSVKGQGKFFINAMPQWFLGWTIESFDIFDISACLVRLSRLGLIELMYERITGTDGYDELKSSDFIVSIFNRYVARNPAMELEITATNNVLYINEFGQRFSKACL